jgi:hypothetical protein
VGTRKYCFFLVLAFVGTHSVCAGVPFLRDARAYKIGSHAGAWEPEKIYRNVECRVDKATAYPPFVG